MKDNGKLMTAISKKLVQLSYERDNISQIDINFNLCHITIRSYRADGLTARFLLFQNSYATILPQNFKRIFSK